MGSQGPDQGYALRLARLFLDTVTLDEHEHRDDILAGTIAVALQRASHFGRGPIMSDVAVAFALWGIQPVGSQEHTAVRRAYFSGAAHDYVRVRAIVDGVRDEAIALNVPEIAERNWRELLREPRQGSSRIDGGVS